VGTFERFTDRARRVLVLAQEEARLLDHGFIGTEHLVLALISEGEGVAAQALEQLGVEVGAVRERVVATIGVSGSAPTGSPPFTPRAKKVLELSLREALQLGHNYIGTEHILLGIVREGEGVGAQVLVGLGADAESVRQQVTRILANYQGSESGTNAIAMGTARRFPPLERDRSMSVELVGRNRTWRVVRAGRTPTDYSQACEDLAELLARDDIELDDMEPGRLVVMSVETNEGPGLALSISQMAEHDHLEDEDEDGGGDPES
jgi:ATP-dependent Clp protease ATP-binding subunit ClpA